MKKLSASLILVAIAAGAGYLAYQMLLTDEAKESIAQGVKGVGDAYTAVKDTLQDQYGVVMEDEQPLFNVEETKREWEALGY